MFVHRLHGSFLLLKKAALTCELAGAKQLQRLRLGHFWGAGLNHLAAAARIRRLALEGAALCSGLYGALRPVLGLLPGGGKGEEDEGLVESLEEPLPVKNEVEPSKTEQRVPEAVLALEEAVVAEDIGGAILFTVSLYFEHSNISPQLQKWWREVPSPLSPKTMR